jgi:hypothetical protein
VHQPAPNQLSLRWTGVVCDTTWTVVVLDELPSIDVGRPEIEPCTLVPQNRAIQLTFEAPFHLGDVVAGHGTPYQP